MNFFPLQGVNAPERTGNRDSDRRARAGTRVQKRLPPASGTDKGQEVWPLLADTLGFTVLSR